MIAIATQRPRTPVHSGTLYAAPRSASTGARPVRARDAVAEERAGMGMCRVLALGGDQVRAYLDRLAVEKPCDEEVRDQVADDRS